jgi:hypothetical protein
MHILVIGAKKDIGAVIIIKNMIIVVIAIIGKLGNV